jgi:puromycin-sensitive aminopeptidase
MNQRMPAVPGKKARTGTVHVVNRKLRGTVKAELGKDMSEDCVGPYRLSRNAVPIHYDLRLEVNLDESSFQGDESIAIILAEASDTVVLHAVDLEITTVYASRDGRQIDSTATLDSGPERLVLSFERELEAGEWLLHIGFAGRLGRDLAGLYQSPYRDSDGNEHTFAATQFEPAYARRAFPCWDEPEFKATFRLRLVVDRKLAALSNACEESAVEIEGAKREIRFKTTIRMSTYLVALVIGDVRVTPAIDAAGVPLRIAYFGDQGRLTEWAKEIGAFSLGFFTEYYGIAYPGEKLDLVAVPDCAAGGMENFGLITCRESALLVDRQLASRAELERVADIVCHEVAHMWFGDLVTMKWWDELWLNEAFATFMGVLAEDAFRPEWLSKVSFGLLRSAALQTDGSASTRSIQASVASAGDVTNMFDVLTYQKGASILAMLEHYLGEQAFRKGVSRYLTSLQYSNATGTDLWSALETVSRKPVGRVMNSWIVERGFPLVCAQSHGQTLLLKQQPFTYDLQAQPGIQRWQIPIVVRAVTELGEHTFRLTMDDGPVTISLKSRLLWILVNSGGHGYYRVLYTTELLEALLARGLGDLDPIERFSTVSDLWATTVAGSTTLSAFRAAAARFVNENDINVWRTLIASYRYLEMLADDWSCEWIRADVRDLALPMLSALETIASENSTELQRELQGFLIAEIATLANDSGIQERAVARYKEFCHDRRSVAPELVSALTTVFAHCGAENDFEHVLEAYRSSQTPQEKQRYLLALGEFQQPASVQRVLEMTLSDEMRRQDVPSILRKLLSSRHSRYVAWDFVSTRWEKIIGKVPDNAVARFCEGITSLIDKAEEVHAFFDRHEVAYGSRTMAQHLEHLKIAQRFREREAGSLVSCVRGNG